MLKVLDICVQTSTNDPFGAVEHAVLTCTAGLVPVLIGGKNGHDPDYHLETLHGVRMGSIFFDVDPQRYDGAEFDIVFCIHLGGPRLRDSQGRGLAVLPTGNKENEYRRVGIIPDLRRCTEFSDSEVKEITII
jgi:hypothetical protein